MVKTDDNRYKHSDLVALQWGKEASVMPQMRKWADEATCVESEICGNITKSE